MNDNEVFAKKYSGIIVRHKKEGLLGRVVGYNHGGSLILMEYVSGDVYKTNDTSAWQLTTYINNDKYYFHSSIYSLIPPEEPIFNTNSAPDNCDDCGAVGEQKCKDNCPNK